MAEVLEEKKRKREGRSSAKLSLRERALPRLFDDLVRHLGFYDFVHYPVIGKHSEVDFLDDLEWFRDQLKRVQATESFITALMKYRKKLFENDQELEVAPLARSNITPLEQKFMQFNHILGGADPRRFLPEDVQFGVDLEELLKCLPRCYGPEPRTSKDDLDARAVRVEKRFQKRPPGRWRIEDEILAQASPSPKKRSGPPSVATKSLKQRDKQNLFAFSEQLQNALDSEEHIKRVRSIDSNALVRHKRACAYVDALFEKHKKLTFAAVDLCFDEIKSPKERGDQLKEFKNKIRKNPRLPNMVGFLGKWEYTPIKGLYARMICIFKKQDEHIEDELPSTIGRYWQRDITQRAEGEEGGTFHQALLSSGPRIFNCSVCSIAKANSKAREQLKDRVIFYLTYSQEYYRYRFNENFDLDLKKYEKNMRDREAERKKDSEEGAGQELVQKPRKPRESSGRYKTLPDSDEPHDIFFKGELLQPDSEDE